MTTGSTVKTREPMALTGADLMGTARATLLAPFDLDRGELDRVFGLLGGHRIDYRQVQLGSEVQAGQVVGFKQQALHAGVADINTAVDAGQWDGQGRLAISGNSALQLVKGHGLGGFCTRRTFLHGHKVEGRVGCIQ